METDQTRDRDFEMEVLRINERYLVEIVERFDFCPWARKIRNTPQLVREVIPAHASDEALLDFCQARVEALAKRNEVDIALLIFPQLAVNARDFRKIVSRLEQIHIQECRDRGEPMILAMAAFHPHATADLGSPGRLVPFIRRSPDPTIQLVRRTTIDKVAKGGPQGSVFVDSIESFLLAEQQPPKLSVTETIGRNNLKRVQEEGVDTIEQILEDIMEDRARSYAKFAPAGMAAPVARNISDT